MQRETATERNVRLVHLSIRNLNGNVSVGEERMMRGERTDTTNEMQRVHLGPVGRVEAVL
jgi:hypothetical protein